MKKTSKRSSFLRSVRRRSGGGIKDAPLPPTPPQQRSAAGFDKLMSAPLSSSHGRSRGAHHLSPIDEAVFSSYNHETQSMSLSPLKLSATEARGPAAKPRQSESTAPSVSTTQGTFAARSYAPSTSYAPSVVSTVQATNGHAGASTLNLPAETASVAVSDRPASPPRTPAYPTHEPEPAAATGAIATASGSAPGLGLPPALGSDKSGPVGKKGGLMARIGTARKVSGDKIVKFFNNTAHKDEPASASSTSGGGAISAFLRDTKPGMPPLGPVSGAATSAATPPPPPPPKKKSDDSASVLAKSAPGTPSLEAAAEFDSAAANAYDGLASPTEEGFPASTNNGHGDASAEKETLSTSQQVSGVLSVPRFCLC